ncbi:MAG: 16S rRNA (guanine(966)-N(2))-methyltransferase RsmD [Succinivibrionaceae bacterium]|nr:16S rRNA (guanine(966)-N(2))-methyltransferase RsmD [Succinivibrionaceae bacterium]
MGNVRIISGRHRGRRLQVLDEPGLRPTTDRVRETLFNWLQFRLKDTVCLDLFAGAGAIGFEAASRYARKVVMVELNPRAASALKANAESIRAENVEVQVADARELVSRPCAGDAYDVVFLDPPYHNNLLEPVCRGLEAGGFLKDGSLVYVEHAADEMPALPDTWEMLKSSRAGACVYSLYVKHQMPVVS